MLPDKTTTTGLEDAVNTERPFHIINAVGDLLFLWNRSPRAEVGEIVVYNVRGKDIPIVHRVVRTFPEIEGKTKKVKEISEYALPFVLFNALSVTGISSGIYPRTLPTMSSSRLR